MREEKKQKVTLHVKNVSTEFEERDLLEAFSETDSSVKVLDVRIVRDDEG